MTVPWSNRQGKHYYFSLMQYNSVNINIRKEVKQAKGNGLNKQSESIKSGFSKGNNKTIFHPIRRLSETQ